jgi:hypothetical protein
VRNSCAASAMKERSRSTDSLSRASRSFNAVATGRISSGARRHQAGSSAPSLASAQDACEPLLDAPRPTIHTPSSAAAGTRRARSSVRQVRGALLADVHRLRDLDDPSACSTPPLPVAVGRGGRRQSERGQSGQHP